MSNPQPLTYTKEALIKILKEISVQDWPLKRSKGNRTFNFLGFSI